VAKTDSMLLKNALGSNSSALAPKGGFIHEIKTMLSDSFLSWRSCYCPRECSKVAHVMVALGCTCPHDSILSWNDTPPDVEDLVARDCASSLS
jgi:hypothetical protein